MKFTNKYNVPQSVYDAITKDNYDLSKTDLNVISATTLIYPPKQRLLKFRHWQELEEDVIENTWRLLGQAVHYVLQQAENSERLTEERINVPVNGKIVSGQADIYESKIIQDYKITSVWSVVYSPDGKPEWENQLNVYAWLYRRLGFEVNKLRIIAILRDWSKSKVNDGDYPILPIVTIEIPLWSFEKQQQYIEERVKLHQSYESATDDEIPICSPEERWAKPTTWAIYKNSNKRATKVCGNVDAANELVKSFDQSCKWRIEKREGEDTKCKSYCSVKNFCNYYKEKYDGNI